MHAEEPPSVLFVMPPGGVIPWFAEHLGAAFLRAMLARAGIGSLPYLPERNVSLGAFASFLSEARPRVVGLTAYESNLRACGALSRAVRETLPEAVVIAGGPNATFSPEETLALAGADVCLRGAGEGTIAGIVQAILGADRPRRRLPELLSAFPNLVIGDPDGVRHTAPGDLSSFPALHFRRLDDLPSPYQAGLVATRDVGYLTARGCNQHCTYCSFAAISGRRVHYHGVERVLEDLAALKRIANRVPRRRAAVSICDDAFTLAPRRAREICEGIVARGLEMPFDCETRADRVDADLLRLMKRAGFVSVSFGLESAVPRVLRAVGKVQDPAATDDPGLEAERAWLATFREAVAAAKGAGLAVSVSIIGGLPGETADDLRETLAFVQALKVDRYTHNVLTLLPGTPLYDDRERHGLRAERHGPSGKWRTKHAYDVGAVSPLPNSMTSDMRWGEANLVSDALCGRPRPDRAADGCAWAAVVHDRGPDRALAAWLRDVLPVNGVVVAVSAASPAGAPGQEAWLAALLGEGVPFGLFALLEPEGAEGGALRSLGTEGHHRFEIEAAFAPGAESVVADDAGNCRVRIWIASAPTAVPPPRPAAQPGPTPQIADGCRFWSGWRRCERPRVLHVWPDSSVTACWHGPVLGRVGDRYGDLAARGAALTAPGGDPALRRDRCPKREQTEEAQGASVAEAYEIAAQFAWLFGREAFRGRE